MSIEITPSASLPKHVAFEAIVNDTVKITAISRGYDKTPAQAWAKSKAYDVAQVLAPELVALEPFTDYSIPFKPEDDDDKVRAGMWSAWKRETMKAAAWRLQKLIDTLVECEEITTSFDAPHKFSHKAGCSCGCSPAFILGGHFKVKGVLYPVDISLEAVVPKKEKLIADIEELLKPVN